MYQDVSESVRTPSDKCHLLTRLPAELREIIYKHVLTFTRPLKLRQVVAGSPNTSILRANHQIYHEALPVLYDVNTILCSRNDFCNHTDSDLQTPLRRDQVRHLLVKNFSQSIKCASYSGGNNMYLSGCCEVCQPTATGFLSALSQLPKLRTAVIDYRYHISEFSYMKRIIRRNGAALDTLRKNRDIVCTDIAQFSIQGASIPNHLRITFSDIACTTLWRHFTALASEISVYGMPDEKSRLEKLRDEIDRELPDKLYFLHCARHSIFWPTVFERIAQLWKAIDDAKRDGRDASEEVEALTEDIARFVSGHSVENAKLRMRVLRAEEARLTELMRMS